MSMQPPMRRIATMVGVVGAVVLVTATAFGTTRINIWKTYGEKFQLGYVVGYLDAVTLSQRKDQRAMLPTGGGKNFDRWVNEVNAFYENPANANRPIPDAMSFVGQKIRTERMEEWNQKAKRPKRLPRPSPGP